MKPPSGGPDHGADQCGNRQVGERTDDLGLADAAQDDEAPNRHHHRSADALDETRADEGAERTRHRAKDRAEHEDDERRAEDRAGAVAVRLPAGNRDEDGEADEIGGQRQLQCDRILAERGGDHRQRGRDHRRVGVLHEERTGDDQGQEFGALQVFGPWDFGPSTPGQIGAFEIISSAINPMHWE